MNTSENRPHIFTESAMHYGAYEAESNMLLDFIFFITGLFKKVFLTAAIGVLLCFYACVFLFIVKKLEVPLPTVFQELVNEVEYSLRSSAYEIRKASTNWREIESTPTDSTLDQFVVSKPVTPNQ